GLGAAVAALFGGTAGGIALDDVEFGPGRIAVGAIGEFAGKTAAAHDALADGFAGLAGGFAGAGGVEAFVDDPLGDLRVGLEIIFEFLADDSLDDPVDLAIGKLGFGLSLEARFGDFDRDDGGEALAGIVAGDVRVLFLKEAVGLRVGVDDAGEGGAKAGKV